MHLQCRTLTRSMIGIIADYNYYTEITMYIIYTCIYMYMYIHACVCATCIYNLHSSPSYFLVLEAQH